MKGKVRYPVVLGANFPKMREKLAFVRNCYTYF